MGIQDFVPTGFQDAQRVAVKEFAVGFQVQNAAGLENAGIAVQKSWLRKPVFGAFEFDLRVGEGDPYFRHLTRGKSPFDQFDLHAQKGHIFQPLVQGRFGAAPHPGTFDVDAYEIFVRILAGQGYGIIAFAATQFQNQGIAVAKKILVPPPA